MCLLNPKVISLETAEMLTDASVDPRRFSEPTPRARTAAKAGTPRGVVGGPSPAYTALEFAPTPHEDVEPAF